MYAFHIIYILAAFVQIGVSLIEEDTDLNSLSSPFDYEQENFEEVLADFKSWQEPDLDTRVADSEDISQAVLQEKCKNANGLLYISEEDLTIDCDAFNNAEKPIQNADVVKRSADEEQSEVGSGDNEIEPINEESKQETPAQDIETTVSIETTTSTTARPETTTTTTAKPETTTTEPTKPETTTTEPTKPESTATTTTSTSTVAEAKTISTSTLAAATTTTSPTTPSKPEPEPQPTTEEKSPEQPATTTAKPTTHEHHTHEKESSSDKKPSDKDVEIIRKPGGRTLINGPEKEETREENGDKSVKANESTENTKKAGSKDTSILIGLFVAVVIVGALAFGYNFVKKRRQRNAELERVERGEAPVKRSAENPTKPDAEAEKKPLIENGKEVEMVNMKKETNVNNVDETQNDDRVTL